jgi:hypothetical protein
MWQFHEERFDYLRVLMDYEIGNPKPKKNGTIRKSRFGLP